MNRARRLSRRRVCAAAVGASTWLAGCAELGLTDPPIEDVKNEAVSPGYDQLLRNISEYRGEYVHYRGVRVSSTVPDSGGDEYLINMGTGQVGEPDLIYGIWNGDPFRDGDDVELWGEVTGTREVDLIAGMGTILPEVTIYEMALL